MNSKQFKLFSVGFLIALAAFLFTVPAQSAGGFAGEKFMEVVYFEHGGKGALSGRDAGNAKAIADTDLMTIAAGTVIENVYVVIQTGLGGTTVLNIGDDDDADGFMASSVAIADLSVAGIYGYPAYKKGAYLKVEGDVTPDAYVNAAAKYYAASGKEVKLDITTASSAGKFQVVIEGYKLK